MEEVSLHLFVMLNDADTSNLQSLQPPSCRPEGQIASTSDSDERTEDVLGNMQTHGKRGLCSIQLGG